MVTIDEFTNLGKLSVPVSTLTDEAEQELREGIPLNIEIVDRDGTLLLQEAFSKVSFKNNGEMVYMNADSLQDNLALIAIKEHVPHYLQLVREDNDLSESIAVEIELESVSLQNVRLTEVEFDPESMNDQFLFEKIEGEQETYVIRSVLNDRYLTMRSGFRVGFDAPPYYLSESTDTYPMDLNQLAPQSKFTIERKSNGQYAILDHRDLPLRISGNLLESNYTDNEIALFRIISLNIDWEVVEIDTKHLSPIYPSANTSFGFNSTLVNCGTGLLTQEVGIEKSIESSSTVGWEEALAISSRNTFSVSVTMGAEVKASFFGNEATYSSEVTASYEYSKEVTQSSSSFGEKTETETDTYFSKRMVQVPAKSASLVYDAYQTYSNVEVPFVQRFRVSATGF